MDVAKRAVRQSVLLCSNQLLRVPFARAILSLGPVQRANMTTTAMLSRIRMRQRVEIETRATSPYAVIGTEIIIIIKNAHQSHAKQSISIQLPK